MSALTDYSSRALLNWLSGKTAMPAVVSPCYLALYTVVGTDAGAGFTEVTGGSYARAAISAASWNAASGSAPATTSINTTITFPLSTAAWGTVVGWGLTDAVSGGNLLVWDWLGNFNWVPFTGTLASPSVITVPAHGFNNSDTVIVSSEFGGALPTGFATATSYTVASVATDTFNLGQNTTTSGSGSLRKYNAQVVPNNTTVSFASGALTITSA